MKPISKVMAVLPVDLALFLSWVYVDRVVVESAFRPISAWDSIHIYHYAMGIGFTAMFLSLGLVFLITTGMKLASIALSATGIGLMKLGPADLLYYWLFRQSVPKQLEWLDNNQAIVEVQVAAEREQRAGVELSPYVTDVGLGVSVILIVAVIAVVWLFLFTHYGKRA